MKANAKFLLAALGLIFFLGENLIGGLRHQEDLRNLVEGNNRFALELYREIGGKEKNNLFLSPFSISSALAMAYAGARGKTEREMAKVLHFSLPQKKLHPAFGHLLTELRKGAENGVYILKMASSLWAQKDYPLAKRFLFIVKNYYEGEFFQVDFRRKAEVVRIKINRWVEKETAGKIKELLKPRVLRRDTRLLLTNAIYFKGSWSWKFKEKDTRPSSFFTPKGRVKVAMMNQTGSFNYLEIKGKLQVLELPYAGNNLSMVILLPAKKNGLNSLEKSLNIKNLNLWLSGMHKRKVEVYLPKFKIQAGYGLGEVLKSLGMRTAFSKTADFSGITGKRGLFISEVVHRAYVEVNEKGTEAAAATGVVMGITSAPPTSIAVFKADHPFVFVILHKPTGSILFMGRLTNPAEPS